MKKTLSLILVIMMLFAGTITLSGCTKENSKNGEANANVTEISYVNGKGTFKLSVPKDSEGKAKYEFTKQKPAGINASGSFYLVTDNYVFVFSTSGLVYNTSAVYKNKYGDKKATFDGYIEWVEDAESKIKLHGMEKIEINGRKALRYDRVAGSSSAYKYYGYNYLIAGDDIYSGSRIEVNVVYPDGKSEDSAKELDAEAKAIIESLKIEANN